MTTHALIGFAEALPAPEVVFSLLAAGHRVSAFARSSDLPLAHLPLSDLHVLPSPETDATAAIAALSIFAKDADVILPLDDTGLWLTHAALPDDPRIAGVNKEAARDALDKVAQIDAARSAGLAVPPTLIWDGVPEAAHALSNFPAIVKPGLALKEIEGRLTKGDATYIANTQDASAFFATNRAADAPWLIQPLIEGQGQGVFGFVATDGTVTAWSGHRRLRMMNPHGSGASACESFSPDTDLTNRIAAFLTALDWRGPFMVELLRDTDDTPWFIELNGRMWGSMALARRQGFEYPAWAVAQTLDATFKPTAPTSKPLVLRHLGRDLLHLAFVARGPKSAFHRKNWPSLTKSLPAVLRPNKAAGFYNYDPAFPSYFMRDALWTVKKALRR